MELVFKCISLLTFSVGYYGRTNSNDYQKYNDSLPSGRNSVPGCRAAAAAKRHHEGSCNEDDDGDTGFPGDGLASSLSASGPSIQPRSAGSWHHPLKEHWCEFTGTFRGYNTQGLNPGGSRSRSELLAQMGGSCNPTVDDSMLGSGAAPSRRLGLGLMMAVVAVSTDHHLVSRITPHGTVGEINQALRGTYIIRTKRNVETLGEEFPWLSVQNPCRRELLLWFSYNTKTIKSM